MSRNTAGGYHGSNRKGPYFEGWYLKFQTGDGKALALIPAVHTDRQGHRTASLQVLTRARSWWLEYPEGQFQAARDQPGIRLGKDFFTPSRISLHVERDGLSLHGTILCGPFTPLPSDIMGPFRFLPGLECSHGVVSMTHPLEGWAQCCGTALEFTGGVGYIETDRGRSFPSAYLWTQCLWHTTQPNSLMLSIATIPTPLGQFTGCICALYHNGRHYRLATYRGARVEFWSDNGAVIRQGTYRFSAELLDGLGHPLHAPVSGQMSRTIHEHLCSRVRYRFWEGQELLFERTDPCASFEYAEQEQP